MKNRWLRRALWVLGVAAVFIVLATITRNLWLKPLVVGNIEVETGLRVELDSFGCSLNLGSFQMRGLRLFQPAEFGGGLMADIPEMAVDLDTDLAARGKLHLRHLKLVLARLNIVKNTAGQVSIQEFEKHLRDRWRVRNELQWEYAGIDRLELSLRTVSYADLRSTNAPVSVDLAIEEKQTDTLKTQEQIGRWFGGLLLKLLVQVSFGQWSDPASTNALPVSP
jgi:hypothetical protein